MARRSTQLTEHFMGEFLLAHPAKKGDQPVAGMVDLTQGCIEVPEIVLFPPEQGLLQQGLAA